MKASETRQMTVEELKRKDEELRRELFTSRIKRFTENTPDTSTTRKVRKDLARIRTVLREIELGKNAALFPVRKVEE
jgi:large subunit ribosomal protein L29